ncbi:MAG: tetratricopeptide repeat protein [Deltaproteobacteria bacterium]|nr:tetratricopeptide repeat protein [Deltaproteobacteria bacterium]
MVFEDLVDDLRSGELDAAGRRQLSMVLQGQRGARMDLAMLDLFDEPRALKDEDFDVADLVGGVMAQLDAARPSGVAPAPERLPFDPIPAPAPVPEAAKPAAIAVPATRAALGKPRMSGRPMTTTQKLAVQFARRPFLRPWLAAAVVLLSLSMGWTARGLFVGDAEPAAVAPTKAPIAEAEPETRTLGSDDLLAFAENAVSRDQHQRAARLYQELIRRFPRSAEAGMAQLGLARLQLEVLGDPSAAATRYGAFLRAHPDDDLAPDAALGRARALEAAGSSRADDAWRAIEERYPESDAARLSRRRR